MSAMFEVSFDVNVSMGGFKELIQNTVANQLLPTEFIDNWEWKLVDQFDYGDKYKVNCNLYLTKGDPSEWVPQAVNGQLLVGESVQNWNTVLLDNSPEYMFRA